MSLSNISFLGLYFPLLLFAYYNPIVKTNNFRKILLSIVSLGLYAFCEPVYVLLLLSIIVVNYLLVSLANKLYSKLIRGIAIAIDVIVILFFKYINVLSLHKLKIAQCSKILFPVGLSYFIFKTISYVVDSVDEKNGNILDVTLYISNFITIVSGPLSTYKKELPFIKERQRLSTDDLYGGFERIMIGFGKKVIIADSLKSLSDFCFSASELSIFVSWVGAISYSLQLYFDFSGYTDIALGIGKLLGFQLPENFYYPYMADSITDFWKRWHISLTKWFTQYIYIPLGGSRVRSAHRHILNLFIVWMITGVWHGTNYTFLVWAMLYFTLQTIEKYTKLTFILKKMHIERVYTLTIVVLEWVIFRSNNIQSALKYIGSMFGCNGNTLIQNGDVAIIVRYLVPIVCGIVLSVGVGGKIKEYSTRNAVCNIGYNVGLVMIFLTSLLITCSVGYSAPLYAGF